MTDLSFLCYPTTLLPLSTFWNIHQDPDNPGQFGRSHQCSTECSAITRRGIVSFFSIRSLSFSNAIDFYNSRFPRFEENGPAVSATRMPVSWSTRAKLVALSDAVEQKWKNSVRYIMDSFLCLIKQIVTSRTIADATMLYNKLFLFRRKI